MDCGAFHILPVPAATEMTHGVIQIEYILFSGVKLPPPPMEVKLGLYMMHLMQLREGYGSLVVSSEGILNYAWEGADGVYFGKTTISNDPTSWGQAVLVLERSCLGFMLPNIAVDPAGKAYIMATRHYRGVINGMVYDYPVAVFTKESTHRKLKRSRKISKSVPENVGAEE